MKRVGIISIHGGDIEPGTSEIAKKIAGDKLPLFLNEAGQHIPSINFDNNEIRKFLEEVDGVISIHGEGSEDESFVMIGGLDVELANKIKQSLEKSGFETKRPPENLDGDNPKNICNKDKTGKGIQLEISQKLRGELIQSSYLMNKFAESVRVEL